MKNMEDIDEEFNNFMYRVTEVNNIVKKLSSTDKRLQEMGTSEADKFLNDRGEKVVENLDEGEVVLHVKSNRTVLNEKALHESEKKDENTMSQESFMAEVSKDADKRYKDKLVRTERMETFKKQATLAFRRKEYERALCCYNKAIEQIKDSPLLYNNRCLTYTKLKMYDKAIVDAETALRLNEDCLKSHLFLARAHYLSGNVSGCRSALEEAKARHPKQIEFINDFEIELGN